MGCLIGVSGGFYTLKLTPFFLKKIAAYNRLSRKPTVIMRCSRLGRDGDHLEMVFVWWWRRLLLISQPPHEVKINHSCDFKSRKLWGALSRLITPWTTFEFGCQNDNWNWIINIISDSFLPFEKILKDKKTQASSKKLKVLAKFGKITKNIDSNNLENTL